MGLHITNRLMHLTLRLAPRDDSRALAPATERETYDIIRRMDDTSKILAFCMSSHSRLGGMNGCEASALNDELLRMIASAVHERP